MSVTPTRWAGGALIGLTSGSTGRAKGVVQSEAALAYASSTTIGINGLRPGDTVAAIVPLSSAAAYCFGAYLALSLGGPLVLWQKWDPPATLARMTDTDVRWTMCVPTMALQLGAAAAGSRALEGVRSITVGGGPMDVGALARAEESARHKDPARLRHVRMPRPHVPDAVRPGGDPARSGRSAVPRHRPAGGRRRGVALPPGELGRAQVRGPSLFLGYARHGKLDPPELTPDGFLPTGDLLMTNEDGTVSILGREKDVIIRGGRNIDVSEIERALASHPRVRGVCVVPVPDEVLGERVAALVVTADGPLALDDVTDHLRGLGLSKTKWPEFVFTVDDLPQTTVGKISRAAARDLAATLHERLRSA